MLRKLLHKLGENDCEEIMLDMLINNVKIHG